MAIRFNDLMPTGKPVELTGRLYDSGRAVRVDVAAGRVARVAELPEFDEGVGGSQRWIVPGFYDLQVNGFAGVDLMAPELSLTDVRRVALSLLQTGCTRFLPTVITADLDHMCRNLSLLAEAMDSDPLVRAMCPGMHAEGPFIHPEDGPRGAHPRQHIRQPNVPEFRRLYDASRGRLRMLTLAPEQPGAIDVIREAVRLGVVVALGHHRSDHASLEAAVEAGARLTTHLGNGADAELPRNDNYVWSQLGEDRLWATLIADGHHLPPPALKSIIRAKTPERVVLITDAMAAAGMPAGRFTLGDTEAIKTPEGRVYLPGTPYLAGSGADMPMLIQCVVRDAGLGLVEAVRLTTSQPAKLVPTAIDPWACEAGSPANLVELDWDPIGHRVTIRKAVLAEFALLSPEGRAG